MFLSQSGFSQYHQFHQYTVADGLPFTEVSSVFVSQKGYVWTAGIGGVVCRFDGVKFDCDSPVKLGVGAFSHRFYEAGSRLWLITDKGPPVYFKEGEWHKAANSPPIEMLHKDGEYGIVGVTSDAKLYRFDSLKNEWKSMAELQLIKKEGSVGSIGVVYAESGEFVIKQFYSNDEMYYWKVTDLGEGSLQYIDSGKVRISYLGTDDRYVTNEERLLIYVKDGNRQIVTNPEGEPIYLLRAPVVKRRFCVIEKIDLSDGNSGIRILEIKDGVARELSHIFSSYEPLNIDFDKQGNIWMCTHGGLFRVEPAITTFFEWHPNMISALHVINEDKEENIWFGGYGDGLCYFDGKKVNLPKGPMTAINRLLPGQYKDDEGNMFFWEERIGLIKTDGKNWRLILPPNLSDKEPVVGYTMLPMDDGRIALGISKHGLGIATLPLEEGQNWKIIGEEEGIELVNVLTIAQDQGGRLWCGRSSRGIAIYDPEKDTSFTWMNEDFAEQGLGTMSMSIDRKGNLWLGTRQGLYIIESPEKMPLFEPDLRKYAKRVHVKKAGNSMINALSIFNEYLVFSNEAGHGFLDLNSYYSDDRPKTYFFDTKAIRLGGSGEQNAIFTDSQGKLWIGKDRGAIRIDMQKMEFDTTDVNIHVHRIMAGNEHILYDSREPLKLPVDKRTLRITIASEFRGRISNEVSYEYRVFRNGQDESDFTEVNSNGDIRIDYLSPGKYQLEILAFKNNQLVDELKILTYVPYHWFEDPKITTAGISIIALSILSVFYAFYRSKYQAKKSQLEVAQLSGKADQMQVEAIASALNPHFINNSLHWLQSKVRNDPEAVKVIGRMSENIRMVFQQSRKGTPYHSLREELKLVENYLYIQHIRYDGMFQSEVADIDLLGPEGDILVPILEIQIHVENAIEHGIRNRIKATFVRVDVMDENEYVHITISDDGVGRKRAKELESKGTQQGVLMLDNLHKVYNQNNDLHITSRYEDLPFKDNETGEPVGTIVHIKIPKNYNYEIRKS